MWRIRNAREYWKARAQMIAEKRKAARRTRTKKWQQEFRKKKK